MNILFYLLIFIVIFVIYVSQNKDIITKIKQQLIPTTKTPATETPATETPVTETPVTETPQITETQPEDCVGTWINVGTCNIDSCDPSNIGRGLGKQTQEFLVQKYSENEGKPCPGPTREVECSIDNYIECVQCGGLAGNYTEGTTCTNINSCEGTMGIGQREDTWSANKLLVLPNCAMPANKYVSCTENNFPACTCSYVYDHSRYADCKENNIFCEGDTGICISNYTKTTELPGGICPAPNYIFRNLDDPLCTCRVERRYGPWTFTTESCGGINNKIPIGTRIRTITITKIGGNKDCKIIPEPNEQLLENTTGILNIGGYFQFEPEVDVRGGTFQTVQIENNFNNDINDKSCVCEGTWTEWKDITSCPDKNDYTKSDNAFRKKQYRDMSSNKQMYPNMICPRQEREIACPRDCSGSFVNNVCKDKFNLPINCDKNTTGSAQGTITNTFKVLKSKLDGEDNNRTTISGLSCPKDNIASCNMSCDVDCEGTWIDTGTCKITKCDPSQNRVGLGKKTQIFSILQRSYNQGIPCPGPTREVDCSLNNFIDCVQCGGLAGNYTEGASCKNFKNCKGIIGIGEREDTWTADSLTSKTNCIMKPNKIVPCEIPWEGCTCSYVYDQQRYADCNENNIFCEDDTGVCTTNYTKTDELPGGICPLQNNIYRNPDEPLCTCKIQRRYEPWTFTIERCGGTNNQVPIGTRTRTITITKIGGYKRCKIRPEPNEKLLQNTTAVLNVGGYFQFKPEVDVPGGTFQTVQIENNFNNTDINDKSCICEGTWTIWRDITSCPDRKDYTKSDIAFKKTQRRDMSSNKRIYPNMICPSEERELRCPRDCSGSIVTDVCKDNLGLPISCKENKIGIVQGVINKTFKVFRSNLDGEDNNRDIIPGLICEPDTSERCERRCDVDCIGFFDNTETCNVTKCDPSQNRVGVGKQTQKFITIKESENLGEPCKDIRQVDCSLNNYIDCVQCGGLAGDYTEGASCKNIKSCNGIIGIGEREDIWTADSLTSKANCIMKPNKIVPCEIPWVGCECRYDISDSKFCNENNIFCEGDTSVCTLNYTKTTELPGGICPAPNNIYRIPDDQQCTCRVERKFEPWNLEMCNVDGTGVKIRSIAITKLGGYKACKVLPEPNEELLENTTGIFNVGGYFQFKPEVDVLGGTFQTFQIDNCPVNCIGNWDTWSDCDATCNGINASITGKRTRTYRVTTPAANGGQNCPIANNTTETDSTCQITGCPVDCSGNWSNWSNCVYTATCDGINALRTGIRRRTYTRRTFAINGGRTCSIANNTRETISDPTCQITDCPVDCSWNWNNWSACSANTGQRTKTINITINPLNNGRTCPVLQPHTVNCAITNISGTIITTGDITNSTDTFMIFKTGTTIFTVQSGGVICDILMIGGGGAGGFNGGGGGAGACIVAIGHTLPGGNYKVTVGAGAVGTGYAPGGNSSISVGATTLYLAKGGGSGAENFSDGEPGGCGGGGGRGDGEIRSGGNAVSTNIVNGVSTGPTIPIQPTYAVFGNKGGNQLDATSNNSTYSCPGGGGIGAAGGNHANGDMAAGSGGAGLNAATINGITYNFKSYFANNNTFGDDNGYIGGGGAGTSYNNLSTYEALALRGIGGGGKGAVRLGEKTIASPATSGAENTGSGGGGGYTYGGNSDGGSGIVIIRYRSY